MALAIAMRRKKVVRGKIEEERREQSICEYEGNFSVSSPPKINKEKFPYRKEQMRQRLSRGQKFLPSFFLTEECEHVEDSREALANCVIFFILRREVLRDFFKF